MLRAGYSRSVADGMSHTLAQWSYWLKGFTRAVGAAALVLALAGGTSAQTPDAPVADVAAPSPPPSPLAGYLGLRIRDIQFRGPTSMDEERMRASLELRPGDPLDKEKLRDSIQTLYNTGFFQNIEVEAERIPPDEMRLVIALTENYFVGAVNMQGAPKPPPTTGQLVNASKLDLGGLVTEEKIQTGLDGLQETLTANGYHKAGIEVHKAPNLVTQQMDIGFAITPGPIARVGNVKVNGDAGYPEKQVVEIAHLQPGKRATLGRTTAALERLRKKYQKQNRLEAQAAVTEKNYDPASNTESYVLNVDRGPVVEIRLNGAKLRKGLLKKYVPVYEENAVDADLLAEGARNIRDYFQTKGFFDVRVDFREEDDLAHDRRYVVFNVNKGQRHKLVAIELTGNKYFSTDELREHMVVEPSNMLLRHGRYSQTLAARDAESIENLYASNGFQDVHVQPETIDDYKGVKGHMKAIFRVSEGEQTRVASFQFEGNQQISSETLRGQINTSEGQPFSDSGVASDREALLSYYFNQGFPNAQFESSVQQASVHPPRVNVTYRIKEGERVFVDQVLISGLHYTHRPVVERQMELRAGEPLSQNALLDTQRRLYDLGLFNEVNVAVQNPDGMAPEKNVLFQLEEAKRWTFNYGIGLEAQTGGEPGLPSQPQGRTGVSPRVSFDVTRINLGGRDQTLLFKSSYGRLQQRALISYEAPHFLNREGWKIITTGFYDTTRDVRTFTAERLEGSAQLEDKISRISTILFGLTYRRVKVDPTTLQIDPNQIPLLSKPVRVGAPTFTFIRDKRDDPLDAHKGNLTTVSTAFSSTIFGSGSNANFSRFLINNSTYQRFRKNWVFARNTRVGVERLLGGGDFVPLPERLYAGGANSHRGFAINQAGPRDLVTGFPLGGNGLFLNQLELRLPPPTLPLVGDNFSVVLFHDFGNVFAAAHQILPNLFRISQRHEGQCDAISQTTTSVLTPGAPPTAPTTCEFRYMSHALGAGLRYRTPIGPVRVDVGYNLNPPTFPIQGTPPALPTMQRLKHVNFYFSLGQTF